jgi:hypothetical protein
MKALDNVTIEINLKTNIVSNSISIPFFNISENVGINDYKPIGARVAITIGNITSIASKVLDFTPNYSK